MALHNFQISSDYVAHKQVQKTAASDIIHHPGHYTWRDCGESMDIIAAFIKNQEDPVLAFCEGNILKYLYRYPRKNGVQDLKKLAEYADIAARHLESVKRENG
ncbi:MAG: DUF3310 domain-containing protein [Succiniclasticum sp.]|nr:DUF3310 domain-containing protein [Succiniclasticum sp.]